MSRLDGKVALVTGGSKGIGAAVSRQFAREGARVVLSYTTDRRGADDVVSAIKADGGDAIALPADMRQPEQVDALFERIERQFGALDVLVNNAGIYRFAPLDAITPQDYREQFDTNVLSVLLATQRAARRFSARGGSVVNVATAGVFSTPPNSAVYTATKGAVVAISKVLAHELAPRGIRVNAVAPGVTRTEGLAGLGYFLGTALEDQAVSGTPLGRLGEPDDIAPVIAFLASDEARWITGEVVCASGGFR